MIQNAGVSFYAGDLAVTVICIEIYERLAGKFEFYDILDEGMYKEIWKYKEI